MQGGGGTSGIEQVAGTIEQLAEMAEQVAA